MRLLALIILLMLAACAVQPSPAQTSAQPTDVVPAPGLPEPALREFVIEARQWVFDPATVEVLLGERVRLRITSTDVAHGFAIADYDINVRLPVGQEVVVDFVADKQGQFPFFCNVFCGRGHSEMRGLLIVR